MTDPSLNSAIYEIESAQHRASSAAFALHGTPAFMSQWDTFQGIVDCCARALNVLKARESPAEQKVTAMLAESTRWQQDAQSLQEQSWANVYHSALTRVCREVDAQAE